MKLYYPKKFPVLSRDEIEDIQIAHHVFTSMIKKYKKLGFNETFALITDGSELDEYSDDFVAFFWLCFDKIKL